MTKKDLIYGIHPMLEAARSGQAFDKVFIRKGMKGSNVDQLKQLLYQQEIPLQSVPVEKLNRLTGKNHQGIIGLMSPVPFQKIEDIVPGLFEAGKTPFILILDQISDIRNFGAITRTAEAAGVHALVIPGRGAASINADAMKTSAGALNYIPVCRSSNLIKTCEFLINSGITIAAASEKAQEVYYDHDLSGPIALVMGSEGEGISPALLEKAQVHLKLPMKGNISSLNVSVAAGILIYEIVRQNR